MVKIVEGTVVAVAVLRLRVSGFVTEFELGRQAAWRSEQSWWCRQDVDGTLNSAVVCAFCCCLWLRVTRAHCVGSS